MQRRCQPLGGKCAVGAGDDDDLVLPAASVVISATPLDVPSSALTKLHITAGLRQRRPQPRALRVAADLADHRHTSRPAGPRPPPGCRPCRRETRRSGGRGASRPAPENGPRAPRGPRSGCRRRRFRRAASRDHRFLRRHMSRPAAATMTAPVVRRRVGSWTPICARPRAEDGDDDRAQGRGRDGAASAGKARPADDDRRDRFELEADAGIRIGGRQPARLRDGRERLPGSRTARRRPVECAAGRCRPGARPRRWRRLPRSGVRAPSGSTSTGPRRRSRSATSTGTRTPGDHVGRHRIHLHAEVARLRLRHQVGRAARHLEHRERDDERRNPPARGRAIRWRARTRCPHPPPPLPLPAGRRGPTRAASRTTAALSASTDPTERSMPPVITTSVMPVASSSASGIWLASATIVVHEKKCSVSEREAGHQQGQRRAKPQPLAPGGHRGPSAVMRSTGVWRSAGEAPGVGDLLQRVLDAVHRQLIAVLIGRGDDLARGDRAPSRRRCCRNRRRAPCPAAARPSARRPRPGPCCRCRTGWPSRRAARSPAPRRPDSPAPSPSSPSATARRRARPRAPRPESRACARCR